MGGSTTQKQSSTQTTTLPQNQQQNVDLLMQGGKDYYNSGGPKYFQGQNYTTPTSMQTQGRDAMTDFAQGSGTDLAQAAVGTNQFWLDPSRVFDLNSMPGYNEAKAGIAQTATQQFLESVLPQSRGTAISGGQLGGSRQGQMDALAAGRASEGLGRVLADLDFNTSGRNMQMQAAALANAPRAYDLGVAPGGTMEGVGRGQRMDQAEQIAGDKERWDFGQKAPMELLAMLQALTGSAGQYGGTVQTDTTSKQSGGGLQQALGAALTLGSMFLPGIGPAMAAGGMASGLGGLLGGGQSGPGAISPTGNTFGSNAWTQFAPITAGRP